MLKVRESKNRKTFGEFLRRKGFSSGYALASLFIAKFSQGKKITDWQSITSYELKERGLLPCEKHKTFSSWRNELVRSGVLICMASKEELQDDAPNHKGSMFKYGLKIEKYIKASIDETMPKRMDDVCEKVEQVSSKVSDMDLKFSELERKVESMSDLLLHALPPDTPERRKIIAENIHDKSKCFELLKENLVKEDIAKGKKVELENLN